MMRWRALSFLGGFLGLGVLAAMTASAAPAPQAAASGAAVATFAPLERWRAAVIAGDKAALDKFYLPDSPAYEHMRDGQKPSPMTDETPFWSWLGTQNLTGFQPKILQMETLPSKAVFLVLRVEMTFRVPGGEPHQSVTAVRQTWVNQNGWHIAASRRGNVTPMEAISLPQPTTPNPHLYPDPTEAQKELSEAMAAAKADHKRVLVIFGATWCYDCHVLDATLRSRDVAPLVAANYHVIHINVGDGESNTDMAERFQVPLNRGIPSLAVLDGNGQLITSQKNGEFESAARIGMKDVTGFLERWKPEAKK